MTAGAPPFFHFVSLFPETIQVWFTTSILGRAHSKGLFDFDIYQLRSFSNDKHKTVDDSPYGGGTGMVLKVEPLVRAVENIEARFGKCSVIYFSPAGRSINQDLIGELSAKKRHTILICGHYEGVDQRFIDHWVDYEVSLGDFVMTGGEIAAIALVDALIRHIPGTLGEPESVENESFKLQDPKTGQRLLEYPQYTRPAEFQKLRVPEALLSGHHDEIRRWRMDRARERTNRTTKIDKIGTRRDT